MTNKHIELPAPSFRLTWWGDKALYKVSKPNIDSTDCYTPDDVRAAILADRAAQQRVLAEQARVVGEPVAWMWDHVSNESGVVYDSGLCFKKVEPTNNTFWDGKTSTRVTPLFASPPAPLEAQAVPQSLLDAVLRWYKPEGDSMGACENLLKEIQSWIAAPVAQPATEQAEAPSDSTLRLAEMILSDCGHSTAISTRLRDRVAERIERHIATQPTASNAGELTDTELLQFIPTVLNDKRKPVPMVWLKQADAFKAIRAALASKPPQAGQKPAAVVRSIAGAGLDGVRLTWLSGFPQIGMRLYTAPHPEPVAPPAREALIDLMTHRGVWRKAVEHLARMDDSGYWPHELKAYDKAMVALDAILSATPPAQAVQDSADSQMLAALMALDVIQSGPHPSEREVTAAWALVKPAIRAARGDEVNQK